MIIKKILAGLSLGLLMTSSVSNATPVTFFDTITSGQASFTSTVTGTGASVSSETLSGLSGGNTWNFGDFSIASTDGANSSIYSASTDGSTGQMIGINPQNPIDQSGITFTFASAINALGFEVGDWGTCCHPSSLFIAFDGGSTQLVGTADSYSDNPAVAAGLSQDAFFIGAIDDTSTFTTITFYGDGLGEFLTAGGTIMYSAVDIGSVGGTVPEPSSIALLMLGIAGFGFAKKKKV